MNQKNGTARPLFEYRNADAEEVFLQTRRLHDEVRLRRAAMGFPPPDADTIAELRKLLWEPSDPNKVLTPQEQFELARKAGNLTSRMASDPEERKEDVAAMLGSAVLLGEIVSCNAGRLHELEPMPGGNAATEYAHFIRVAAIRTGQLAMRLFCDEGYAVPNAEEKFETAMIPLWYVEGAGTWDSLMQYTSMLAGDMWEWHDYYEDDKPGKRQPIAPTDLFNDENWQKMRSQQFDVAKLLDDPFETYRDEIFAPMRVNSARRPDELMVSLLWDAVEMALHVGCRAPYYLSIDTPSMREEFAPVLDHYSDLARTAFLRIKEITNIMFWYLGYDKGWKIRPSHWHGMTHDIDLDYDMTQQERANKMEGHAHSFMSLLGLLQTDITRWDASAIFSWAKSLPDTKEGQDKLAKVDPSGKSAIWEEN